MSADYEVTITVKTNVPVMAEDMTGLDAINVAMDYGLSRMLKNGEYKLVDVAVERVAVRDDDDADDEYQDDDVEPEPEPEEDTEPEPEDMDEDEIPEPDDEDQEPEDTDEDQEQQDDTDGNSDYQDADDDPEPEITEVQFTEPDKGDIVIAKRKPGTLPLPKIGG